MGSIPPPSEPDVRISRIRLSSQRSYLREDKRLDAEAPADGSVPSRRPAFAGRPPPGGACRPREVSTPWCSRARREGLPLVKPCGTYGGVTFGAGPRGTSAFLHPLAQPALPGVHATMGALTPAGRWPQGARVGPRQVSLLTLRTFRPFRLQPPLAPPIAVFGFLALGLYRVSRPGSAPDRHPSREVVGVTWASPFTRRLAKATGRIEFTDVTDESFASGCSPPRLAATQLPPATRSQTSSRRGLAPRLFSTFTGARVRRASPLWILISI